MKSPPAIALDVFYPIVPDIDWMRRLVPLGVKTIQLRLKDAEPQEVRRQVRESLALCERYGCQLILNDYWELAIEEGATFIHLGQEDLAGADLEVIRARGLRLGISSHDEAELDTAIAAKPDYVALGPVYETKLKAMKWAPQGLDRVRKWKERLGTVPLVAIGGITPERAPLVVAAGADSIAVITDFFVHTDPEARVRTWLDWASENRNQR